jgi:hypothetical protein
VYLSSPTVKENIKKITPSHRKRTNERTFVDILGSLQKYPTTQLKENEPSQQTDCIECVEVAMI